MTFAGHWLLLDIEGTTSSVRFVFDVLFPYARDRVGPFLDEHFERADVQAACAQIARDDGAADLGAWLRNRGAADPRPVLAAHVRALIAADRKLTGLKALQGLIWTIGYRRGELRSHVYPDVPPALERWRAAGRQLAIYSSGSVQAQKQFFAHTEAGNLLHHFVAHFDTTVGGKREAASYERIARALPAPPAEVLFLSDVAAELDAARSAGLHTLLVVRDGGEAAGDHPRIASFDALELAS